MCITHPGLLGGRGRDSGSVFEQLEWENPLARDSKPAGALLQPLPTLSEQASKQATRFQVTVTNLIAIRTSYIRENDLLPSHASPSLLDIAHA